MPSFAITGNSFLSSPAATPYPYQATSGTTYAMTAGQPNLYLTNGSTIATLTIRLPPASYPGQTATITSAAAVTTLTVQTATGGAVAGAPTALVANTRVRMEWISAAAGWVWVK